MKVEIAEALRALRAEIQKKSIIDVKLDIHGDYIIIELVAEDRQLCIGFDDGKGYFITSHCGGHSKNYFKLTPDILAHHLFALPGKPLEHAASCETSDIYSESSSPTIYSASGEQLKDAKIIIESISSENPDIESLRELFDRITTTERGIDVIASIASIKAHRSTINHLNKLLSDKETTEAECRKLLFYNPWMLGTHYSEAIAQERSVLGEVRVDLILSSALGYVDIVELKRPNTPILVGGTRGKIWQASAELSHARAQARLYLRLLDDNRAKIEENLGLSGQSMSRMYRSAVIIVAGRSPNNPEARKFLRDFNFGDARMLLMTYDDILSISEATVNLFERRIEVGPSLLS